MNLRFVAGLLIMVAWGGLVINGLAPADDFIRALNDLLVGLGIYHVANQKGQS